MPEQLLDLLPKNLDSDCSAGVLKLANRSYQLCTPSDQDRGPLISISLRDPTPRVFESNSCANARYIRFDHVSEMQAEVRNTLREVPWPT